MSVTDHAMTPEALRLWPGVAIVTCMAAVVRRSRRRAGRSRSGMLGALPADLLIVVWWLFFSRAPWSERLGASS